MPCAGALLTGGASRRMGQDKARLRPNGGQTLAERTARLLTGCTAPCVELGPGVSGLAARPDAGTGPLDALAGASRWWSCLPGGASVLVVATDLPRLDADILRWLARHPATGAVVPIDRNRPQPLCARYPVRALRALGAATRPESMMAWIASMPVHWAQPEEWTRVTADPRALRDADTPDDLRSLTI